MKIVNTATMMDLDRRSIHELGLPSLVLMERAALGITEQILYHYPGSLSAIHILVGTGNNGGDGLAIARLLHCQGYSVQVWLQGDDQKCSPDNIIQREINQKLGIKTQTVILDDFAKNLTAASLIIDALFGVGLCREITGTWAEVIASANAQAAPKISVDIPSGIHADTGQILGTAIQADLTVACAFPKWGHYLDPGLDCIGNLETVDIGIPPLYYTEHPEELLSPEYIKSIKPRPRKQNVYKGSLGRLGIVAGSMGMSGAAQLAASAALETGVGLVFLYVPANIQAILASALPDVQVIPIKESANTLSSKALPWLKQELKQMDALLIGPGLGRDPETALCLAELLNTLEQDLVLDADALYHLSFNQVKQGFKQKVILTPHPGELACLLNKSTAEIQANRVAAVRLSTQKYRATTVLKGARSLIAHDSALWFNPGGNPGMARGGMGDILAGLCAGFLAQRMAPEQAVCLAVYWHALAGDLVTAQIGEQSLTTQRLLQALPQAWNQI